MFTVTLSPGAVFITGLVAGIIFGVVGLAVIAIVSDKSKKG